MPLKNKTFLSNICLYTFLIHGGGCTEEACMENIGNTDRRIPLTISATVSRYTAIDKKIPPSPARQSRTIIPQNFPMVMPSASSPSGILKRPM